MLRLFFASSSVVSHAFSALCVYSKSGHHPYPYATSVPNFVYFTDSIAELTHGEKSRTQSLTYSIIHSINQSVNQSIILFDAPGTEQKRLRFEIMERREKLITFEQKSQDFTGR